ncbi:hypothetical protein BN1723_019782, partial [Verticillium longisporum]
GG